MGITLDGFGFGLSEEKEGTVYDRDGYNKAKSHSEDSEHTGLHSQRRKHFTGEVGRGDLNEYIIYLENRVYELEIQTDNLIDKIGALQMKLVPGRKA